MVGGRNSMIGKGSDISWLSLSIAGKSVYTKPTSGSLMCLNVVSGRLLSKNFVVASSFAEWSLLEAAMNVDLANISGKAGKELGSFGVMMDRICPNDSLSVSDRTGEILDKTGYKQEFDQMGTSGILKSQHGELGRVLNSDQI